MKGDAPSATRPWTYPVNVKVVDWRYQMDILKKAMRTVASRGKTYGEVRSNHERIAAMWSVTVGTEVSPEQVAMMMIQVKLARLMETPDHKDSWVDIAGYAWTGDKCVKETAEH